MPPAYAAVGSVEFSRQLLAEAKSACHRIAAGDHGDDHVRFAVVESASRTHRAVRDIMAMFEAADVSA